MCKICLPIYKLASANEFYTVLCICIFKKPPDCDSRHKKHNKMNRTLKFRGKLLKDGESFKTHKKGMIIEGGYYEEGDKAYIAKHSNIFEVDKETVTQMTGFIDEGGDVIYEGDIVENSIIKGTVIWRSCSFVVYDKNNDWLLLTVAAGKRLKIIGNIYDKNK